MSIINNILFLGKETSNTEIYSLSFIKKDNNIDKAKLELEKKLEINTLNSLIDLIYGNYDLSRFIKYTKNIQYLRYKK